MNVKAIIALVSGILAVVLSCVTTTVWLLVVALVLGILGIVFGALGMKAAKTTGSGKGLAIAGLVCGIVATAFAAIMFACVACVSAGIEAIANS